MSRTAIALMVCALLPLLPHEGMAQRAGPHPQPVSEPARAGWVETAWLTAFGIAIAAKLDTGADNSSLDAGRYDLFEREGRTWVRFSVPGHEGEMHMVEAPVVRIARIRRAGASVSERPVISLALCVAGRSGEAEVTLTDRSGMDYPMLIGRSFLAGRLIVDSGRTRVGAGTCQAQ